MSLPAYLLVGEELLVEEALDEIRRNEGTETLAEASFDPSAAPAELLGALRTPSLLGGRRLVILREADGLGREQADAIAAYLRAPSPDSVLVLVASGRTRLDTHLKSMGGVVVLEPPKGRRLVGWIKQRAAEAGLKLDDRAAWALVDCVGTELRDLHEATQQLLAALGKGARARAQDVRALFPRLADEPMYVFTDALGERRLDGAMTALRRLLLQGEHPLVVFGALAAHLRRLLRARRHADQGAAAVAEILGLPEWRAERVRRQALSYSEEELIAAIKLLAAIDLEMKATDRPEVPLERAVVGIASGELLNA